MSLQHSNDATLERHVLSRAQQALRPEIFARITEKLVFNRLSYEHQLEIAEKFLSREIEFLAARGHSSNWTNPFCRFSCEKDFIPSSARARCAMPWKNWWATRWPGICWPETIPAAGCRWMNPATASLSVEQPACRRQNLKHFPARNPRRAILKSQVPVWPVLVNGGAAKRTTGAQRLC